MYSYGERLSAGVIQIEPEWGGWYSVSDANADRLRNAASLGNPGMAQFFKVIDEDKIISTFSVRDPGTGELKPWEPSAQPDPRLARAMSLGYGPNPTPEMLDAADQGIAYEDWRRNKLLSGTPGGTATAAFGVGGPTSQPTAFPAPTVVSGSGAAGLIPGRLDPNLIIADANSVGDVKPGPENQVLQTPTGQTLFSLGETMESVPLWLWVALGAVVAVLILKRRK